MRHIRRIDEPLKVLASGYVEAGGLGTFDPLIYEEVEGPPPVGAIRESRLAVAQKRAEGFNTLFKNLSVGDRILLYPAKLALQEGDTEAVIAMVEAITAADLKKEILAVFEK